MSTPKNKAGAEAAEQLQIAFEQVDKMSERLDELKQSYNKAAKELATLRPEPLPSPPPVKVGPKPLGLYSIPGPLKSEYPLAPLERPRIPRPEVKGVKAAETQEIRRRSGRFYIQVANGGSLGELHAAREQLSKVGRVVDSGVGTASDPSAGWLEVAATSDIRTLIDQLRAIQVREVVEKVIEVEPGEGRLLARQIDLFRKKMDSRSGT